MACLTLSVRNAEYRQLSYKLRHFRSRFGALLFAVRSFHRIKTPRVSNLDSALNQMAGG